MVGFLSWSFGLLAFPGLNVDNTGVSGEMRIGDDNCGLQ